MPSGRGKKVKVCKFGFTAFFGLQGNTLYRASQISPVLEQLHKMVERCWNTASGNLYGGQLFTQPFIYKKHSTL